MRTSKLTPLGRLVLFIFVVGILLGGGYAWKGKELFSLGKKAKPATAEGPTVVMTKGGKEEINISLDQWVGWKPYLDANGGLTTKSGSIYDKLGLKVNFSVIDDATQSSNALIAGDINGAGYTVNRYAFLYPKFVKSNVPVKMVHMMNSSNGGDGIIAKDGINRVEDLVGKKIAVPRYSEAQTLVEWVISKSSLTAEQKTQIRKDMVLVDTPDDAAKAFFAGKVDAAATWQPYLTQATSTTGAKVLFSTSSATNIILDGIIFRQDYLNTHKEQIQKFIEGAFQARSMYETDLKAIKDSMPLFASTEDKDIKAMTGDAMIFNHAKNKEVFDGIAQSLFTDMAQIWKSLGENADPSASGAAFDDSLIKALSSKYTAEKVETVKITEEQKTVAAKQDNSQALLKQSLNINFATGAATIKDDSFASLTEFANTAKILNGVVIQIEGNTDSVGDDAANMALSQSRAQSVARYLQAQGLDISRMIVIGNGETKPVGDNNTDAGKAANRRTDVFFKVVK